MAPDPTQSLSDTASVVMLTPDRQIDRRILQQAESLRACGWRVDIVAMPLDSGVDTTPGVQRIGAAPHRRQGGSREGGVLALYRWMRRYVPMNGALMRIAKRLAWRFFVDQESFYLKLFLPTALRYRPSVFVAHDLPMLAVAHAAAAACGARVVYDSHELFCEQEFSAWEKRRWAEIEGRYVCQSDLVITVNASIAGELQRRYALRAVEVIQNAEKTPAESVTSEARRFHRAFGLSADSKVLLLQGGLSAGRNLEVLLEAMCHVENPQIVLVFLGDGQIVEHLQARAAAWGLRSRVFFHPAVPQQDLLAWTVCADAGVIPYQGTCLNNVLCTPNKMFEFIAAGLPIVGTDLPEIRRMVQGEDIGLVGETGSAAAFGKLLEELFADAARFGRWRERALALRARVCWEVEGGRLCRLYEALR